MNRVEETRKRAGVSQRELAKMAKVSQSTIQRIEAGIHPPKRRVAAVLAAALKTPVSRLFPVNKTPNPPPPIDENDDDVMLTVMLADSGTMDFITNGVDRERVLAWGGEGFIAFPSTTHDVYLNGAHVRQVVAKNLPQGTLRDEDDDESTADSISILYLGDEDYQDFTCEPDPEQVLDDKGEVDYEVDEGPLRLLGTLLESCYAASEQDTLLSFEDVDGDLVRFRPSLVVAVLIDHSLVNDKFREERDALFAENDAKSEALVATMVEGIHSLVDRDADARAALAAMIQAEDDLLTARGALAATTAETVRLRLDTLKRLLAPTWEGAHKAQDWDLPTLDDVAADYFGPRLLTLLNQPRSSARSEGASLH